MLIGQKGSGLASRKEASRGEGDGNWKLGPLVYGGPGDRVFQFLWWPPSSASYRVQVGSFGVTCPILNLFIIFYFWEIHLGISVPLVAA